MGLDSLCQSNFIVIIAMLDFNADETVRRKILRELLFLRLAVLVETFAKRPCLALPLLYGSHRRAIPYASIDIAFHVLVVSERVKHNRLSV